MPLLLTLLKQSPKRFIIRFSILGGIDMIIKLFLVAFVVFGFFLSVVFFALETIKLFDTIRLKVKEKKMVRIY